MVAGSGFVLLVMVWCDCLNNPKSMLVFVRFTNWIDFCAGVSRSPFNFDLNVGVHDSWCSSCVSSQVQEASRILVLGYVLSHFSSKPRRCCVGFYFSFGWCLDFSDLVPCSLGSFGLKGLSMLVAFVVGGCWYMNMSVLVISSFIIPQKMDFIIPQV